MTVAVREIVYLHAVLPKDDGERSSWGSFPAMTSGEVKTFVPARDFDQSKKFYQDLGFELAWSDGRLAYFRHGNSSFLLQHLCNKDHVDDFLMHLLVVDVEAWWQHVQDQDLKNNYHIKAEPPVNRPWGIRDFIISDPNGIVWRIGQSIGLKENPLPRILPCPDKYLLAGKS